MVVKSNDALKSYTAVLAATKQQRYLFVETLLSQGRRTGLPLRLITHNETRTIDKIALDE
jgi:hypothetical protein